MHCRALFKDNNWVWNETGVHTNQGIKTGSAVRGFTHFSVVQKKKKSLWLRDEVVCNSKGYVEYSVLKITITAAPLWAITLSVV